jgi:hypothetical protein
MSSHREFVVPSLTRVPSGYSPEHKVRINQQPEVMFEIMQNEGSLIGSIPLEPDVNLWAAVAGSPYCNPQESESAHFLLFAHNHEVPSYYDLQNLDPSSIAQMIEVAYDFLADDPDRRGAGYNMGPQNEPNVESSQGWKNLHFQCFTMPCPESRTHVDSVTDEQILTFIQQKRSCRMERLEPVTRHMARQSAEMLPEARVHIHEEMPNQWTMNVPLPTDNLQVASYLIHVDAYLKAMHSYHLALSHADVRGARPTQPIYTVGFGVNADEKFVRVTLQNDVGGSKMGIAETAFGMWPLRSANSPGQSYVADGQAVATEDTMQEFAKRTHTMAGELLARRAK